MKRILYFLILISTQTKAQNWDWAKSIGSWASELGFSISSDKYDNLYVTGNSHYTTGGSGSFYYDILWKLDKYGNTLWQDTLWGDANIATDSLGNSYVACADKIAKYNTAGQRLWIKTYPNCFFRPIKINPLGGFIAIGNTQVSSVSTGCVYSCDINGNIIWTHINSITPRAIPSCFTILQNGKVYIAGGTAQDTTTGNWGYLECLDKNGALLHYQNSLSEISDIVVSEKGNILLAGWHAAQPVNINGTVYNTGGSVQQFVAQYDSNYTYKWHKMIDGPYLGANLQSSIDSNGNIYISSDYMQSMVIDSYTLTTMASTSECYVAKVDALGNVTWILTSTSPAASYSGININDLIITKKGDLYITGHVAQANHTFGSTILPNSGMYGDLLVAKINQSQVNGVSSISTKVPELKIYPNPTISSFVISYFSNIKGLLLLHITNNTGQLIHMENMSHPGGEFFKTIDLGRQAKGIYFVEISLGNEKSVRKIVIE